MLNGIDALLTTAPLAKFSREGEAPAEPSVGGSLG
jgi:hypothetical protein